MDQENRDKFDPKVQEDRRAFLRRAGKVGVGVPATALLLSVTNKSALAWKNGYGHGGYGGKGKYGEKGKYGGYGGYGKKEKLYKLKQRLSHKYGHYDKGKLRDHFAKKYGDWDD